MNAKEKIHQAKLSEWTARLADQKSSGLTIRQWCDQNQISFHAYNYWKHLLKEEAADQLIPDIVPISVPEIAHANLPEDPVRQDPVCTNRAFSVNRANTSQTVSITINGISFEIDPSVPEDFLASLIRAVRYA